MCLLTGLILSAQYLRVASGCGSGQHGPNLLVTSAFSGMRGDLNSIDHKNPRSQRL